MYVFTLLAYISKFFDGLDVTATVFLGYSQSRRRFFTHAMSAHSDDAIDIRGVIMEMAFTWVTF